MVSLKNLEARLNVLGYVLFRNQKDAFGRKHRYRTSPNAGNGGPTNYFDNVEQLERYVKRVEQVREWQAEIDAVCS